MTDNDISSWGSKGLSNEKICSATKPSSSQHPSLAYDKARIKLIFRGDFLKRDKVTYNHGPIVHIYIVDRLIPSVLRSVKLTKTMILINTNILDMVFDLIQKELFRIQAEGLAKILFLMLI